jgi:hypothetical protein
VTIHPGPPGSWQILLNGEQPEQCDLLTRIVPFARGRRACVHAGSDPPATPGLAWRTEPFDADSVRVILGYRRPIGSVRAEAKVEIRGVKIEECR